jgi:hypothetical protein
LHVYEATVCSDEIGTNLSQCLAWEQVIVSGICTAILRVSGAHRSEAMSRRYSHEVLNVGPVIP